MGLKERMCRRLMEGCGVCLECLYMNRKQGVFYGEELHPQITDVSVFG